MSILADPSDLAAAAERAASESRSGRVLFEAFVPGPEVTVNGFTAEGRAIIAAVTDRVALPGGAWSCAAARSVRPSATRPAPN